MAEPKIRLGLALGVWKLKILITERRERNHQRASGFFHFYLVFILVDCLRKSTTDGAADQRMLTLLKVLPNIIKHKKA